MEIKTVSMEIPEWCNIIIGHAHFIKTAEDLFEVMVNSVPQVKFGLAFCEASGPCLIRVEGNDETLKEIAVRNAGQIGAGHTFVLVIRDAYPINCLNAVKGCLEVCTVHCATANPVDVIVVETPKGNGIMGVIDGSSPKGVESAEDLRKRRDFLRSIGYKL